MSDTQRGNEPDVRMNLKMSRRDYPVLTDEIARLPKGFRRTNRVAHLATLGLLWERTAGLAPRPDLLLPASDAMRPRANEPKTYQGRLDALQLAALFDDGA